MVRNAGTNLNHVASHVRIRSVSRVRTQAAVVGYLFCRRGARWAGSPPKVRTEWEARVDRLNKGGLSAGDFAAREDVHPGTLALWRARLEDAPTPPASTALAFVALDPVARQASTPVPFEVSVGGRTVRVWPHFDAAELTRLVRVLEELAE